MTGPDGRSTGSRRAPGPARAWQRLARPVLSGLGGLLTGGVPPAARAVALAVLTAVLGALPILVTVAVTGGTAVAAAAALGLLAVAVLGLGWLAGELRRLTAAVEGARREERRQRKELARLRRREDRRRERREHRLRQQRERQQLRERRLREQARAREREERAARAAPVPAGGWGRPLAAVADHDQQANQVVLKPRPDRVGRDAGAPARPRVTVVVPSENTARLLAQALSSLQRQDLPDWECVVVDDASTDYSLDVARRFAVDDARFRLLSHAVPAGRGATLNTGLLAARGELVTVLPATDVFFPATLSRGVRLLAAEPSSAGACCAAVDVAGVDAPAVPTPPHATAPEEPFRMTALTAARHLPLCSAPALLRRPAVVGSCGFDESTVTSPEAELLFRVLRTGRVVVHAPYAGVGRRLRGPGRTAAETLAAAELLRAQDAPLQDPAILAGPAPLTRPLSQHLRESELTPELVRALVACLAAGDSAAAAGVARAIDPAVLALHPDPRLVDSAVDAGDLLPDGRQLAPAERDRIRAQARGLLSGPEAGAVRGGGNGTPVRTGDASPPPTGPAPFPVRAGADLRARAGLSSGLRCGARIREVARTVTVLAPGAGRERLAGAVVLLPGSRYHVDEMGPLAEELRRRGCPAEFVLGGGRQREHAVLAELSAYTDVVHDWDPTLPAGVPLGAVVTMNDWGPGREIVESARAHAVPTFAKVEGVQDFRDVDTGRVRGPYRSADVVLGQGPNDVRALPDRDVRVVGSSRLQGIWDHPRRGPHEPLAAVNLNFTYDVQTEHAQTWLHGVVSACARARIDYVLSPHPAQDLGLFEAALMRDHLAADPLRHLLTRAGVLVTRFSTVVYEAIARDVPVVYHNPHGERVWAEQPGLRAAVRTTTSVDELTQALHEAVATREGFRERAREFFAAQVSMTDRDPAARAADVIEPLLRRGVPSRNG